MLKLNFTGNLGKDAETKTMQDGTLQIRFNVAVNQGRDKEPLWVGCAYYRDANQGAALAQYLKKGKSVLVEGLPSVSEYEGKSYLNCRVQFIELLGGAEGGTKQATKPVAQPTSSDLSNDLPF
jgi:single-strand DNA-binding protein